MTWVLVFSRVAAMVCDIARARGRACVGYPGFPDGNSAVFARVERSSTGGFRGRGLTKVRPDFRN